MTPFYREPCPKGGNPAADGFAAGWNAAMLAYADVLDDASVEMRALHPPMSELFRLQAANIRKALR